MLLYFFPDRHAVSAADFQAAALDYALDPGAAITPRQIVGGGPSGGPGCLAAVAAGDREVAYRADQQRWRKIPVTLSPCHLVTPSPGHPVAPSPIWVGLETAAAILPQDLARRKQLAGHLVEMADGREWLAPVARGWSDDAADPGWYRALPARSQLDESGQWTSGDVLPRYALLWQIACDWEEAMTAAQQEEVDAETRRITFDFPHLHAAAVEVLQYNYRLGPAEADLLGILSADACRQVLMAAVDWPTRLAWLQKKTAAVPAGAPPKPGSAA